MLSARDDEKLGRGTEAVCLVVACLCCISSVRAGASVTSDKPQPAAWVAYDLVVTFQHLPKRYSCDDLRYKLSDVLRAIGAGPKSVFPYRCEAALGQRARSPQVRLQFSYPEVLSGQHGQAEAGLSIVRKTIELRPGHPATLTDCGLCALAAAQREAIAGDPGENRELPHVVRSARPGQASFPAVRVRLGRVQPELQARRSERELPNTPERAQVAGMPAASC